MFTNLILQLCQSDCLCRCQMYLFIAFYVIHGGNYKRYPEVFDSRAYSTGISLTIRMAIYSYFHRGKCRLLYFYIFISLIVIDQIFTFSLHPGSGGKPFPDILCDCCCSWAQHNIGHSTFNVEQTPSSVTRLKQNVACCCGVTRYSEELRIFVKL